MMRFDSEVYTLVNYKLVYSRANEILATSSAITDFPFKAKRLIYEQSDIKLCSFYKAEKDFGLSIKAFGSESAVINNYRGAYIIFYNQDEPDYRVRFLIMHEFGHYILNHKMDLNETDKLYHKQELEANCFAAQILMPEQILRECANRGKRIMVNFIRESFGVGLVMFLIIETLKNKVVPDKRGFQRIGQARI